MDHFIETVRKYPCLWNVNAIEYRDQELKDAAWAEVMKETDLSSVKEVKLKWKKLRDSYRDALKRQSEMLAKDPANQSKKNYPWKYMGLMQFLQPYMNIRKRHPEAAPARNGHASPGRASPGRAEPPSSSSSSSSEGESAPPPAKRRRSSERLGFMDCPCRETNRRRRRPALESPLVARLQPAAAAAAAAAPPPDPLDIFFDSMCRSTKRFPFQAQIKIKRTLFEAVIRAEEALLERVSEPASEPDERPS